MKHTDYEPFRSLTAAQWVALATCLLIVGVPLALAFDMAGDGPICRAHNQFYLDLFESANLLGKTEAEVVEVLGEPSSRRARALPIHHSSKAAYRTSSRGPWKPLPRDPDAYQLHYKPYWGFSPYNKFEVLFEDGVCVGYDAMDD